jgi:hypothetical protein
MKKLLMGWLLSVALCAPAQHLTIRDVFKSMPDSLMPYLSNNNRLDFIDFMDSNMKAEVKNQFGGNSIMTALTEDSLSIHMNHAMRVDMLLLNLDEPVDTIRQVVVLAETFVTDSVYGESCVKYYTPNWQPIYQSIPWSEIQQQRIERILLQNILKWDTDKLNKS